MDQIIYSVSNHKIIASIIGLISIVLETYLPLLPLLAIVIANSVVLGMWLGFLVSWVGSSIASITLYYIANKFSKAKIFVKYIANEKTQKIINWIKNQGFNTIFISYACPFIPDFLITITSGFTSVNIKEFILGMACGKFVMFLFISYVGEDITELLSNPLKIIILSLAIMVSFIIGQNINSKIQNNNSSNHE